MAPRPGTWLGLVTENLHRATCTSAVPSGTRTGPSTLHLCWTWTGIDS